jgi:hypothetical protein
LRAVGTGLAAELGPEHLLTLLPGPHEEEADRLPSSGRRSVPVANGDGGPGPIGPAAACRALIAIVVTRVISAVLAVPAFFLNAPVWVMIVEGFVIAGTITSLVLVHQQSRRLA